MRRRFMLLTTLFVVVAGALAGTAQGARSSHHPRSSHRPRPSHRTARPHVRATLTLQATGVHEPMGAVISGTTWQIDGVVSVYKPNQHVALHVFDNGRRIATRRLAVVRRGATGVFHTFLHVGGVGKVTVHAIHFKSKAAPRLVSNPVSVWVVAPAARPDQQSLAVRILQAQLSALHYVVGAPGVYDERTQRAVVALRKMLGDEPFDGPADASVFSALAAGKGAFPIQFPTHGRHIEADLTHQVLALIDADGQVEQLYPMSSGKPSTPTRLGSFSVYYKTPGINDKGMVDSSYFSGGDAIHGYAEVPTYAASHGCLRVPVPEALTIYDWAVMGTPVDVYYR